MSLSSLLAIFVVVASLMPLWCLLTSFCWNFFCKFDVLLCCKFDASLVSSCKFFFGRNWCLFHLFWQVGWVTDATKNLSKCTKEPTERDYAFVELWFSQEKITRVLWSYYCCMIFLNKLLSELWNTWLHIDWEANWTFVTWTKEGDKKAKRQY